MSGVAACTRQLVHVATIVATIVAAFVTCVAGQDTQPRFGGSYSALRESIRTAGPIPHAR